MYKISKLKFDILQNLCAYNQLGHAGSENVKHYQNGRSTYLKKKNPTEFSSCCAHFEYITLQLTLHLHWNFFNSIRA